MQKFYTLKYTFIIFSYEIIYRLLIILSTNSFIKLFSYYLFIEQCGTNSFKTVSIIILVKSIDQFCLQQINQLPI